MNRPFISLAPDAYISLQGSTDTVTCGKCQVKVDFNKFVTSISTDCDVNSPPGSASIQMQIPDTELNQFMIDDEFIVKPMMEIEIFGKGYYSIGGTPRYYRIFWGLVMNINKSWSNGVTNISISCSDMLKWWELTYAVMNPAYITPEGSSAGNFQFWGNKLAGMNPYAVIIAMAKDSMSDFLLTTGSFTSYKPEIGPEKRAIGKYMLEAMEYWQLKFGEIWNNLVLYGVSGTPYQFTDSMIGRSPVFLSKSIFENEMSHTLFNRETTRFRIQPTEVAAYKRELARVVDIKFFQQEAQTKLQIAQTARDQIMYEFYQDPNGTIIFKPPFYNMNVIPNKPVSWINDFEIMQEQITESGNEVYTHVTSNGHAFGGIMDYGMNDEILTPNTGVIDYHLLKQFGWRKTNVVCEWCGNPRKLFYYLLDYLDRQNSKRVSGSFTIPMRPELRPGFPIWVPSHDAFYYIRSISHAYSIGGQATTTINVIAKRGKFIAPKNIGMMTSHVIHKPPEKKLSRREEMEKAKREKQKTNRMSGNKYFAYNKEKQRKARWAKEKHEARGNNLAFKITFPEDVGSSIGFTSGDKSSGDANAPMIIRDPETGKIMGYPNVVMVYRRSLDNVRRARLKEETQLKTYGKSAKFKGQKKYSLPNYTYDATVGRTARMIATDKKEKIVEQLRNNRYEIGFDNSGLYDYAVDKSKIINEITVVNASSVTWGDESAAPQGYSSYSDPKLKEMKEKLSKRKNDIIQEIKLAKKQKSALEKQKSKAYRNLAIVKGKWKGLRDEKKIAEKPDVKKASEDVKSISDKTNDINDKLIKLKEEYSDIMFSLSNVGYGAKDINIVIRPVSDEFGFEVIGHNRYGRGSFIDIGRLRVESLDESNGSSKPSTEEVNNIRIQFAAGSSMASMSDPMTSHNFSAVKSAEMLNELQPSDYKTGASAYSGDKINFTNSRTYTDQINRERTYAGKVIYADVDSIMKAKGLDQLKPTINKDIYMTADCDCGMMKRGILDILPKSTIKQILTRKPELNDSAIKSLKAEKEQLKKELEDARIEGCIIEDGGVEDACTIIEKQIAIIDKKIRDNTTQSVTSAVVTQKSFVDAINEHLTRVLEQAAKKANK